MATSKQHSGLTRREELAWAAGFYDGEGYCGIHRIKTKNNAKRLNCTVSQVQKQPLERFAAAVGGTIDGPYNHYKRTNGQEYWQRTSGNTYQTISGVFDQLRAFLSQPKTEQFLAALKEYEIYQLETPYTKTARVFGEAGPKYIFESGV